MSPVTIIAYHYVRDMERTRYPLIKGRNLSDFRAQLDYIGRTYSVVTVEQVCSAIAGEELLPPNAAWLTFDDGYLDHYLNVFPLLYDRGWQGAFFPPVAIAEGDILQVNKIHFVLAANPDAKALIEDIRRFIGDRRGNANIDSFDEYWATWATASRFDNAEVAFIKRMLQFALPDMAREELANQLFDKYVSADRAAFAAELYMTTDQLRMMIDCGMYVGSHGNKHRWLDQLDAAGQAEEIDESLAFLKELGAPVDRWVMCYPYGRYNSGLQEIIEARGCAVALTTRPAVATIGNDNPLALPRLDTNDIRAC